MQKEDWILALIFLICGLLLIALVFALWSNKSAHKEQKSQTKIPSAQELLESLQTKENDLNILREYSKFACENYERYMGEMEDFDLKFIAILTSHKGVNAKLILEIERYFKKLAPSRKELLDQALTVGLEHR